MPLHPRRTLLGMAFIFAAVLTVYARAIPGEFLWDDDQHIRISDRFQGFQGLTRIWLEPHSLPQYYPLVQTTFWIERQLYGEDPRGYHLANILLHAANACLWWFVLRRLLLSPSPSARPASSALPEEPPTTNLPNLPDLLCFLAALTFALHPVHVESVAWISERKNTLSAFFYLLAALAYFRFIPPDTSATTAVPATRLRPTTCLWYLAALLCYVLAMFSKTVTATLPTALLLALWWRRPRFPWRHVAYLLPFLLVGIPLGLITASLERSTVGATGHYWDFSFVQRLLIAGRALCFYASKILFPHNLTFIYPKWTIDPSQLWQWLFPLAAAATLLTAWLLRRRWGRGPLTALLYFAGTLFPALGFFNVYPMRFSFVADHFQYLASMGVIALVVFALGHWFTTRPMPPSASTNPPFLRPRLALALACLTLTSLALTTWAQTAVYRNRESLWTDTLQKDPDSIIALTNVASLRLDAGDEITALNLLQRAHTLDPHAHEAPTLLGSIATRHGQWDQAITYYQAALQAGPGFLRAQDGLVRALIQTGRLAEAEPHLAAIVAKAPRSPALRREYGLLLLRLNRPTDALPHLETAQRLLPNDREILDALAETYRQLDRPLEAQKAAAAAHHLRPSTSPSGATP